MTSEDPTPHPACASQQQETWKRGEETQRERETQNRGERLVSNKENTAATEETRLMMTSSEGDTAGC